MRYRIDARSDGEFGRKGHGERNVVDDDFWQYFERRLGCLRTIFSLADDWCSFGSRIGCGYDYLG